MTGRLHTRSAPPATSPGGVVLPAGLEVRQHVATFGLDVRFGNGAEVDGTFAGWGSVHNVVDSYGTRMLPGSWTAGGLDDEPYALLWMHNPDVVLGTFRAREEDRGLWIEGRYDATDVGQRARAQAQSGSAPGLSVGFTVVSALADDPDAFNAVRLVEVSQITRRMAATPGALMEQVRVQDDAAVLARRRRASVARARLLLTDTPR